MSIKASSNWISHRRGVKTLERYSMKILGIFLIVGLLFISTTVREAKGDEVIIVKGLLTTERCMKEPVCYLEWYQEWIKNPSSSSLVLFTGTRTTYHMEIGEVPKWKVNSGFGKQVAIKGVMEGKKIKVYDIIPLSGGGKLSKACL